MKQIKAIITLIIMTFNITLSGQIINFSQRNSLLIVRHDTTFNLTDQKAFNGVIKNTNEDGVAFSYYKNGFHTVDSTFYSTGKLKAVIRYQNNKIADRFLFDRNGNKFQEEIYLDSNKTAIQSIWWHPNGQLWKMEMFYNGEKSGKWYEWFDNGNLLFEGEFKQDREYGVWIYYNTNTKEIIRQERY